MAKPRKKPSRYLICIKNEGYPASLELGKVYRSVRDHVAASHGMVRIVDESKEDYLYSKDYFVPIKVPRAATKAILQA